MSQSSHEHKLSEDLTSLASQLEHVLDDFKMNHQADSFNLFKNKPYEMWRFYVETSLQDRNFFPKEFKKPIIFSQEQQKTKEGRALVNAVSAFVDKFSQVALREAEEKTAPFKKDLLAVLEKIKNIKTSFAHKQFADARKQCRALRDEKEKAYGEIIDTYAELLRPTPAPKDPVDKTPPKPTT